MMGPNHTFIICVVTVSVIVAMVAVRTMFNPGQTTAILIGKKLNNVHPFQDHGPLYADENNASQKTTRSEFSFGEREKAENSGMFGKIGKEETKQGSAKCTNPNTCTSAKHYMDCCGGYTCIKGECQLTKSSVFIQKAIKNPGTFMRALAMTNEASYIVLMKDGESIRSGETLTFTNGIELKQENDGNLALYVSSTLLWETGQYSTVGDYYTGLQTGDGNFITWKGSISSKEGVLWKSQKVGQSGSYFFAVSADLTKVSVNQGEPTDVISEMWNAATLAPTQLKEPVPTSSPAPTMPCYSQLLPDERLDIGTFMCSDDGRYRFGFTENRDLAVWDTETGEITWSIPTFSEEEKVWLTMQNDGNAVLRDMLSGVLFATSTNRSPGAFLQIENNGTVRVLLKNNVLAQVVLWNSHVNYFCDETIKSPELKFLDKPSNMIPIDASTMHNKVMAGYQGWFQTEFDGHGKNWRHYTKNGLPPNVNDYVFEMWPDLREFNNTKDLSPTGFQFSDGTNAPLFSSQTDIIVEKHVKWMYDYGIDGVYVQRFVSSIKSQRCVRDRVLQKIRLRSEQYGRIFANMYDMSGANENTVYQHIKTDWIHLVDNLKITESD
eukprot:scaffold22852_cov63-Attheya_sp.AAC.6